MNGNYSSKNDGHYFYNTHIDNARSINTKVCETKTLNSQTPGEIIQVQSKIQFNKDIIIIKDGVETSLGDIMDKMERIEKYLKYLDDGLLISTFDNDGNSVKVNF